MRWRQDLLVALGLAAAVGVVCLPLFLHPTGMAPWLGVPPGDLWYFADLTAFNWLSIVRYHQFPFRSPYHGGGYPVYAHPDDVSLSPRLGLVLAAGPWASLKVDYAVTMFLAAFGMYVLARRQFRFSLSAAVLGAVTFALGGFFLFRWGQGIPINCRLAVLPWVLYFWYRSRDDRRNLLWCGLILASLFLDGKYAVVLATWFVVMWMLLRLDRPGGGRACDRLDWRRFALWGVLVVWAALVAAVKLVPLAPLLFVHLEFGRQGEPPSWVQAVLWVGLLAALALGPMAARLKDRRAALAGAAAVVVAVAALVVLLAPRDDSTPDERWTRAEEAARGLLTFGRLRTVRGWPIPAPDQVWEAAPAGPIAAALALLAVVARPRAVWRWALLAGLFLWIELGTAVPLILERSLARLPGLSFVRQPRSYVNMFLLFSLSLLAGQGLEVAGTWFRPRAAELLRWALIAACYGLILHASWPRYRYTVSSPLPDLGTPGDYYMQSGAVNPREELAVLMFRNIGELWFELDLHEPRRDALQARSHRAGEPPLPGYRGEVYFWRHRTENRADVTLFTPLEIRVLVTVVKPDLLCLNQIRDGSWRTSEGRLNFEPSGTLAVELERLGTYEVRLRYVPVLFYVGAGVSAVSLAAGVLVIVRRGRPARPPSPPPALKA